MREYQEKKEKVSIDNLSWSIHYWQWVVRVIYGPLCIYNKNTLLSSYFFLNLLFWPWRWSRLRIVMMMMMIVITIIKSAFMNKKTLVLEPEWMMKMILVFLFFFLFLSLKTWPQDSSFAVMISICMTEAVSSLTSKMLGSFLFYFKLCSFSFRFLLLI